MNAILPLAPAPVLNLERLGALVMRDHSEWSPEKLEQAIDGYLAFLRLNKIHWGAKIAAATDIDVVWHAHMLDSANYTRDCLAYFGEYLHHDPCLGDADLTDDAARTLELFEDTFGTAPPDTWKTLTTCAGPGKGCGSIHPTPPTGI